MAELFMLIFVMLVAAAAYFVGRLFDETFKVILVWVAAAFIVAIALMIYAGKKVSGPGGSIRKHYELHEEF